MTIVLKKPILVAGISLSFLLWLLEKFTHNLGEIGNFTALTVVLFGGASFVFSKMKKKKKDFSTTNLINITANDFQQKVSQVDSLIDTLVSEAKSSDKLEHSQQNYHLFKQNLAKITKITERENLKVGILNQGNKSFNLSQLLEQKLPQAELKAIEYNIQNQDSRAEQKNILLNSDLIFCFIKGDLTESECELIKTIKNEQQRIIVVFDDVEFSLQQEKNLIWQNIKNSLKGIIAETEVIKISSQTQKIKVIKYQDNLNYQELEEITPVEYTQLTDIYQHIIETEREQLVLLTAYRNALDLEAKIYTILNQIRKAKAVTLIEKYQIVAATTTFANPVASLDLLATAAINTQMIVDLSKIYQQPLSVTQAQEIAIALGKLMVKLGIVELSSQAVANILKTNALTFVAGGLIQGVSAAYLTRICGLSLVEYYQTVKVNQSQSINLNIIKEKIKLIFQQQKENNIFTKFVKNTAVLVNS